MPDIKISQLSQVSNMAYDDVVPVVQELNGNPTTMKATMTDLGTELLKNLLFSADLATSAKSIIGAINELAASGGLDLPVKTATGNPCIFETDLTDNLVGCVCNIEYDANGYTGANIIRRGINIWDEEWESGGIQGADGQPYSDINRIRSKNFIPIEPNTQYYAYNGINNMYIFFYDKDYNYLTHNACDNTVFSTYSSYRYCKFHVGSYNNPITTYSNNISINYPSSEHNYHAYVGKTYSFDWTSQGTVYGGYFDVTKGQLYSTLESDGTEKATPDIYTLTPTVIPALSGQNNIKSDLGGDISVKYAKGELADDITEIVNANPIWREVEGTLAAGNTSITLSDPSITVYSSIDVFTDSYGKNPTNVVATAGSVTLTFEAQSANLGVKVRVT